MNKFCSFIKKHELLSVTALCIILVVFVCAFYGIKMLIPQNKMEQSFEVEFAEKSKNCPIDFKNESFKKAISRTLKCYPDDFSKDLFAEVETLIITDVSNLTDISDIQHFPNLKRLEITNCDIQDITPLAYLNKLEQLNLSSNNIKDLSPVSNLSSLVTIDVSRNQIEDFSPVKNLANLEKGVFDDNKIEHIENLSQMKNLSGLSIANNLISDIEFVTTGNLVSLNISSCKIDNISKLAECETLESLILYGYTQMDLSPLYNLPNFSSLWLDREFDRKQLEFMEDSFKFADNYTKIYLVSKRHGLEFVRFTNP